MAREGNSDGDALRQEALGQVRGRKSPFCLVSYLSPSTIELERIYCTRFTRGFVRRKRGGHRGSHVRVHHRERRGEGGLQIRIKDEEGRLRRGMRKGGDPLPEPVEIILNTGHVCVPSFCTAIVFARCPRTKVIIVGGIRRAGLGTANARARPFSYINGLFP